MCCINRSLQVSLLTSARKLPGMQGSGPRPLPLLPKPALHHSHGRATDAAGHHALAPGRRRPTGLPPFLGKARPDVLSHGTVPRNDVGPRRPRSPRVGKEQAASPCAHSRCSRSCQQAQDAFNNMWEVISHNFLRICKPVSDP